MARTIALLLLVPALVAVPSACGSSLTDADTTPASRTTAETPASTSSAAATSPPAPPTSDASIVIKDFAYTVSTSVAPGATVTVTNDDSQAHTVTSDDGGFDVKVGSGQTVTMTAPDSAGRYGFVCSFHANMSGVLVVE